MHLWYVGNDLISHTTGIKSVLQGHSSLEALGETLKGNNKINKAQSKHFISAVDWPALIKSAPPCMNLFVVDVDGDPLAEHQLHGGRVAELHCGFNDQVNAFIRGRDAV